MKFTCDKCNAQYMISDEKVGPAGVKVRCKKCGTVIPVKRPAAEGAQAPAEAQVNGAANGAAKPAGLDAELGQAFDNAFGDAPAKGGADLAATQAMSSEDAAKIGATPEPAATEWYVAIGQAQVGPLPLVEVKRKWEAGDVGPESLVWRPGMADWTPLSTVADLAGYLSAVPQASARPAPRLERAAPRAAAPEPAAAAMAANGVAAEVSWKPAGASALAALATEELAARTVPAQAPRPAAAVAPSGVRSLVDAMDLPDSGGVDPTGAIPLPIKGLEPTTEKKIERRTSVARGAEEARQKRKTSRGLAVGAVVAVVLAGGAYAAYVLGMPYVKGRIERKIENVVAASAPKPAPAEAPAQPPPAAAKPAEPQPAAAAAQPAVATAPAKPGPAAQAAAEPKPAEPPPAAKAEPPARVAQAEPKEPRTTRRERAEKRVRETRVAQASPPAAPPAPAPAAAPAAKKKDLLDFESNDSALDAALGGGNSPSGRAVYVPPKPGGDLPAKVSPAQINESVAQRIDSLRRCVSEQKAREPDATGVLKMRWTISADGSVRDVRTLTSEYANGEFAQCISGVVKNIRFPQSKTTGQEVTFPFQF